MADQWVELDRVRAALPDKAVFVDMIRVGLMKWNGASKEGLPDRYVAWLTSKAGPVRMVDLGEAEPIDQEIRRVRGELEQARKRLDKQGEVEAEKLIRAPLGKLAKQILQPLRSFLDGAPDWILCPDSQLWLVPWAALPLDEKTYAVEKHTLRYVISGRDLVAGRRTFLAGTGPTIFADPDFNAERRMPGPGTSRQRLTDLGLGRFPRLPFSATEAQDVSEQLERAFGRKPQLLTEDKATTDAFLRLRRPGVLMLSTHGFFLPESKPAAEPSRPGSEAAKPSLAHIQDPLLRCGLVLAGCNKATGGDTGVLTGREILSTDLRGCQLVALSACETGLGDVRNGEGVAGLRQAFQLAGAEAVLATLWKVEDEESAFVMADYFRRLADREGRAEALRRAQVKHIAERRDRFGAAHPYYWAAFTLTGDDGSLRTRN
jgi:CHAT domain-containing protein